ncbi:hypothetical protein ASF61_15800 [Duganella sp. Leaf126]|uniref:DNA-binding protein n=1 Tax=Duganella sp. Leaf126 TaxID=1736266 RepID=UPI0006F71386|nr:DNA-binding protein [Duganella sp. Leaf126]KQQ32485.1 hypothetical protein ASF61_15800 [Duganella sp. Leaf126]
MARTGLSKEEVERARAALLAQGQYPSVDAVRVASGNTGSKSTIHRYLKEIDEEQGGSANARAGAKPAPISDALRALVGRLATQLQQEADDKLDTARAELAEKEQELVQANRQLDSALRTAREHEARLQTDLRQQRLAFNIKQDELAQLSKESSRIATELAHTQQSLYEQLTHARKLEQKVEQLQAQQHHAADLERQLATSMATTERLEEQLQAMASALTPTQARVRELELLLVQAEARAQAQEQMGAQLRSYLDRMAAPT